MAFTYLTNTPLDEARDAYLAALRGCGFAGESETVAVSDACGRVTARAVYAHICAPHYPASAMDGIAVDAARTFGATATTPVTLPQGDYVTVDTGDPVPDGCDAVIMIEDIVTNADGSVTLYAPAAPWQHIRQIGEDICAGEMILPSFTDVTPAAVGAMIAGGVLKIDVIRRPVVGILPTGDEIVPPCEDPKPGDVLEFNSSIFSSMLAEWGAVAKTYPILKDRPDDIRAGLDKALTECDAVLVGAGSSAGRDDYAAAVIGSLGKVLCHGLAIRPGKPAVLGVCRGKPVLGVPGYPVSGILVLQEIFAPILDLWFGRAGAQSACVTAKLTRPLVSGLKYREFVRVRLGYVNGGYVATPLNRGAGVVSSFMKADGILDVPQQTEGFAAGESVTVRLLRPESELRGTLVAIGSHDPLLDEIADLLRRTDPERSMQSTHVGSLGGILAVKRGEAHLAGTHLLGEEDGVYNESFIEKNIPEGGVRLVECVGRTQGLMVAAGNPLGLADVADLTKPGVHYVNRQKGSGTRVLLDYLCRKAGVDTASIYGYGREEFTHTAVAAQIAAGSADAGLGIYSAAKLYGLDFLPVCTEQYDLLIPDWAWETEPVRRLLAILQSDAFRERLNALGGYTIENPGRVRRHFEATV